MMIKQINNGLLLLFSLGMMTGLRGAEGNPIVNVLQGVLDADHYVDEMRGVYGVVRDLAQNFRGGAHHNDAPSPLRNGVPLGRAVANHYGKAEVVEGDAGPFNYAPEYNPRDPNQGPGFYNGERKASPVRINEREQDGRASDGHQEGAGGRGAISGIAPGSPAYAQERKEECDKLAKKFNEKLKNAGIRIVSISESNHHGDHKQYITYTINAGSDKTIAHRVFGDLVTNISPKDSQIIQDAAGSYIITFTDYIGRPGGQNFDNVPKRIDAINAKVENAVLAHAKSISPGQQAGAGNGNGANNNNGQGGNNAKPTDAGNGNAGNNGNNHADNGCNKGATKKEKKAQEKADKKDKKDKKKQDKKDKKEQKKQDKKEKKDNPKGGGNNKPDCKGDKGAGNKPEDKGNGSGDKGKGGNGDAGNKDTQPPRPVIGTFNEALGVAQKIYFWANMALHAKHLIDKVIHLPEHRRLYGAVRNLDEARNARAYFVTVNERGEIVAAPDEMIAALKSCNFPLLHKNQGFKICFDDYRALGNEGLMRYLAGQGALIMVAENYRPDIAQRILLKDWNAEKFRALRRSLGRPRDEQGAQIQLDEAARQAWQRLVDSPDPLELKRIEHTLLNPKYNTMLNASLNLALISDSFFSHADPQSDAFKRHLRTVAAHGMYAYMLARNFEKRKQLEQLPQEEEREHGALLQAIRDREQLQKQQHDASAQAGQRLAFAHEALRIQRQEMNALQRQTAGAREALAIGQAQTEVEQMLDVLHKQREEYNQRNAVALEGVHTRVLALMQ